jgi:hypothetical protein
VRGVSRFFWAISLGVLPFFPVEARERLVMPFDCSLEGGDIHLSPAAETSYRIVGAREEQTVTTCTRPDGAGCRTVMVHRFTVSCAGTSVDWMRVAAAMRSASANRAWIENGRLNLVMPTGDALDSPSPCRPGTQAARLDRHVVLTGDCLPWSRRAVFEHLVLPGGYAPVGELGARLMVGAAADEIEIASLAPAVTPVAMSEGEIVLAKADPDATLEPRAERPSFETALEPQLAADDWITVVREGSDEPPVMRAGITGSRTWAWLAVIASAVVVVVLLAMRFATLLYGRRAPAVSFSLARRDLNVANASAAVAALLQQTEAAARELKGAGPLREVLQGELGHVRERLANIEKLAAKGEQPLEKSAPQFRALVRELERISRIVDSAVASMAGTKKPTTLPRTTSEAYEVLGVNAEVSDGVLKKIVDALRMSWHPDHARDDDDRLMREDRIRQINIAWDLINGKREAA